MATKAIKAFGWLVCGLATRLARCLAALLGQRRTVDVLIYKVDRLGDWFMAEPAIAAIITTTHARGGSVVVWTSSETKALRAWRAPDCDTESLVFEPSGLLAKLRRALSVMRLLAIYRTRTLICLRHSPEPIRDFVLAQADAADVRALSWRIVHNQLQGFVPHEIVRHYSILVGAGLTPALIRELLPTIARADKKPRPCVVIAPFSSAQIKDWNDTAWTEAVAALSNRGLKFELWVGPDQIDRARKLARIVQAQGPVDVTVCSGTLPELATAVGTATLVLTVDTFAAHLAVASDTPTVCLIGGGQFGDFGPWQRSPRQQWVSHPLPCFGCNWQCSRAHAECLQNITSATVLTAIEDVLRPTS
ncbi:MAG: glycosyltransferase family 9 protein [Verrucomicrobia bacterium]|nr:glycosyltransferase family 9 protein [Verrucomicrobiota bacterium]